MYIIGYGGPNPSDLLFFDVIHGITRAARRGGPHKHQICDPNHCIYIYIYIYIYYFFSSPRDESRGGSCCNPMRSKLIKEDPMALVHATLSLSW